MRRREDAEGKAWTYEYDAVGNLVREVDRRGVLVTSDYDERNRRVRRTEVLNRFTVPARDVVTEWAYDGNGNVVEERLPNGNVVSHVYDGLNRRTESSDELGALSTATYDARGNTVGETDANGNELTRDYDALDRLVAEHLPEDRDFAFTYDVAGNRLTHENARGFTTEYEYDALNRLTRTIDPAPFGYDTVLTWDLAGNKKTEQNRRDFVTTYHYDDLDRLIRIDEPAQVGTFQSFTYDAVGNRLSSTDRRGIRTRFAWDRENRLLSTTRSDIVLESNQYDGNGNRIFTTDARGHTTGFEYDERNLLKSENRPLAAITRFVLDDLGDRIRRTDPEGRVTEWSYDLRRRQLREKRLMDPGNSSDDEEQASCYDGIGNRIARFEPEAFAALAGSEPCADPYPGAFVYGFDGANRLTSVTDPLGNLTSYGYDPSGNRTSQTDDNLHTTTFEYDELERLTKKIYPEVGGVAAEESYGYDENGNRTGLTDPLGQVFSWQYDALDRETLATYPPPTPPRGDDLHSIATAYDGNGNVETVTETYSGPSGARTTTQTWDAFDRLRTKTDPEGELLTYGYDPAGNRNRLTDPDGRTTLYQHDALNRLSSVLPPGTGATLYEYFGNSLLKKITYPNGATAAYGYDRANRVTSIENRQHTALVSSYVYAYDRNGNRTSQEETNGGATETTTYVYDDADRLTEVHYPDETVVYTLDGVGNRQTEVTTEVPSGTITSNKTYGYNKRDFLLSVTDSVEPANNTTYDYDVNGNQIEKTAVQSGVISSFIYDVRDQLVEVSTSTGLLETYGYSYDGLRTRKSGPGGLFRFVYDERSLLLQTDLAGLTIAKYEWGPDRLLSLDHAGEGRQFYLFDGLGSVASLSKPDGTLQARFRWDAWGNLRSEAGSSFSLFGYAGYQFDRESGLMYAGGRFYDPAIGRWLTEDPAEYLDAPNLYQYSLINPLRYRDALGLAVGDWWDVRSYADFNPFSRESHERSVRFLQGEVNGAVAAAKATVNAVIHPIETVEKVIETTAELAVNADRILPQLPSALGQAAEEWVNAAPEKQGEVVGEVLFGVVTGAGTARVGATATRKVAFNLARRADDLNDLGLATVAKVATKIAEPELAALRRAETMDRVLGNLGESRAVRRTTHFDEYLRREKLQETADSQPAESGAGVVAESSDGGQWLDGESVRGVPAESTVSGRTTDPARLLPSGGAATLTREQVARLRGTGRERGAAFDQFLAEIHGGNAGRRVLTPLGARIHDVGDIPTGTLTEMAIEGKNYLRFRMLQGSLLEGSVPLSAEIRTQVYKDVLWMREGRLKSSHRIVQWEFAGAPPGPELERALRRWGIPYVK